MRESESVQEITVYSAAGDQIVQFKTTITENRREGSLFLPGLDQPALTKVESIEERDAQGNWTRKRISVRHLSEPEAGEIEELQRHIEYY